MGEVWSLTLSKIRVSHQWAPEKLIISLKKQVYKGACFTIYDELLGMILR